MDNNQKKMIPDEQQIEAMLGQIKPQPSARFYQRMQTAPWTKPAQPARQKSTRRWKSPGRYAWGLAIMLFLLVALSVAFIPSFRAVARQIIYSFIFEPSNQLEVQVTLTNPSDLFNYSDPHNFPSTIETVQQAAGFFVKQITELPHDLVFVGGKFDPRYYAVTLLYAGDDYQIFLTQRPIGHGVDVFSIGSEASVQVVMVGEVQAEYVTGGWKAVSTQEISPKSSPTSSVNISAVWDDSLPQATLRWQLEGYAYELRSLGEGSPSQTELINLANGLK